MVTVNVALEGTLVDELKRLSSERGQDIGDLTAEAVREFLLREQRRRVVERGMADYRAGRVVDFSVMDDWLDRWGGEDEDAPWRG
jgi:predicted transcriptional regulator